MAELMVMDKDYIVAGRILVVYSREDNPSLVEAVGGVILAALGLLADAKQDCR